jgi:hypothetical protein
VSAVLSPPLRLRASVATPVHVTVPPPPEQPLPGAIATPEPVSLSWTVEPVEVATTRLASLAAAT